VSLKLVMSDGVLLLPCPICDEAIEAGLHVRTVAADPNTRKSPVTGTTYGHRVEFIAEAPNLHAKLWGHIVREHGGANPYMTHAALIDGPSPGGPGRGGRADDGLSMWTQEYERIQERNQ
jgi:hypothetical protein